MLYFDYIYWALLACAEIYLLVLIIIKLRQKITVKATLGDSPDKLYDFVTLKQSGKEAGGFEARLVADTKTSVGNLIVKDEKCWVYLPKDKDGDGAVDSSFKKVGYVEPDGYIYLYHRDGKSERIGYLAKPSAPNEPTIEGERSWWDLWWNCRLNVYLGDPEAWVEPVNKKVNKKKKFIETGKKDESNEETSANAQIAEPSAPVAEAPAPIIDGVSPEEPPVEPRAEEQNVDDAAEMAYLQSVKEKYPEIINQIKAEMVFVEGGTFVMGVADEQKATEEYDFENNEGPAHKVTLDSYFIGKYPVTQKIWTAIMGYNPSEQINEDFPVAPVNWNESALFVKRVSNITGLKFSFPTEAQWEFAARGGNDTHDYIYSGSDVKANVAWENQYSPVGKKKANELGIYDMSGLVREWCADWYALRYPEDEQYNPQGPVMPEDPEERKHVVRSPYGNDTVTNRKGELADNPKQFKSYGLRIVCEPNKELGEKVVPVLVGQCVKSGFLGGSSKMCPVTDEARGGAFVLLSKMFMGKNAYAEYIGSTPYGWKDTALLSSIVFSILFLALYFVNAVVLQMPLLGNDILGVIVVTLFYPLVWALVRFVKIESIESGNSFQPFLDLMNKSVGHYRMDMVMIILCGLCAVWTYCVFDVDFIPLILAIAIGLAVNHFSKRTVEPWHVEDPFAEKEQSFDIDLDGDQPDKWIKSPEGDTPIVYNWKLDSFHGKEYHAHLPVNFTQADIKCQRLKNPFFIEKPNLSNDDYVHFITSMRSELLKDESMLLHSKYILQEILKICKKLELDEIDTFHFILDFIQESLQYKLDEECKEIAMPTEYIRFPDEILYDKEGDCDCKSFLASVWFALMGYEVVFLMSTRVGHAALAVAVKDSIDGIINNDSLENVTIELDGKKYYYCEPATDGFRIGDIQDGFSIDQFEIKIEDWNFTQKEEDEED